MGGPLSSGQAGQDGVRVAGDEAIITLQDHSALVLWRLEDNNMFMYWSLDQIVG